MLALHRKVRACATLAVHEADSAEGKGVVEVDESGRIQGFTEKGGAPAQARILINSGLYVLESEIVSRLPEGVESDFGRDVFPAALNCGLRLYALRLAEPVTDIGTPEGLALAQAISALEPDSEGVGR
jgi:NDP-sugar pyrophosphorylase family protein